MQEHSRSSRTILRVVTEAGMAKSMAMAFSRDWSNGICVYLKVKRFFLMSRQVSTKSKIGNRKIECSREKRALGVGNPRIPPTCGPGACRSNSSKPKR